MTQLVLASASQVRRKILTNAGLDFISRTSDVDETAIKSTCRAQKLTVEETASRLADAKAEIIAAEFPGAMVIGADQILEQDGHWFDKPRNREEAENHLRRFSASQHRLITAAVVWRDGMQIWRHVDTPTLSVRPLDATFIKTYLDMIGDLAYQSVGAYQLEGPGAHLFEKIEGDFFSILGLPLLPMLGFLREHGTIQPS